MRSDKRPVPQSYDEIVRTTVPDPDSSQRPSARQEQQAREGFRAMDPQEVVLHAAVMDALVDAGIEGVEAEVDRDSVTLRGHVADVATIGYAEQIVDRVDGVGGIVNRLVVRT